MRSNAGKSARRFQTRVRYGQKRLKRLSRTATLGGIFLSFLKIGLTGFGGGLAVIAHIRTLAVRRRDWFTEREFAEGFALAQSLPGTGAGNIVAYIGLRLRGIRGAAVALAGFILPSMLMMIALAILYRHLRSLPGIEPYIERFFHGLNSAVVALILVTGWRIGRNTLTKRWQWWVAGLSFIAVAVLSGTILEVVFASGLIGIYMDSFAEKRFTQWRRIRRLAALRRARMRILEERDFVGGYITRALAEERLRQIGYEEDEDYEGTAPIDEAGPFGQEPRRRRFRFGKGKFRSIAFYAVAMPIVAKVGLLLTLSSIFLRIGAVTFGGGFVMVPLIEAEVVLNHHWLTHQEFAEAFALGQMTPGPVLITATFIGYRVSGTLGALIATVSVFFPAFAFTVAAGSSLRRFRSNRQVQAFLRGVTPAVVGLLIAAAWSIGHAGIHSWIEWAMAALAVFVLLRFSVNAAWVILGAGVLRFLIGAIVG